MGDSFSPLILFALKVNPSLRFGFANLRTDQDFTEGQAFSSNVLFLLVPARDYR